MTTLQCNEMVPDAAFLASVHQCTRAAIPTSNYCQQHHDMHYPPKFTAVDTHVRPETETRERVTVSATLKWRAGEGPTLKPKYASKPLAVTTVRITINSDIPDRPMLGVSGVKLKKDGTPSQVTSSDRYTTLDELPEVARKMIEDEIAHLRSMLPGGVL